MSPFVFWFPELSFRSISRCTMAKSSSCPQESKAARWAQGDVSLEEIEALSAHLKECSSCSRVFEANQPSWMKPVNWRDPRNWLLVVAAASFYFSMRILQAVFRALPWIFVWGLGFVSGSTIAGVTVWLLGAPRGGTAVWAIGGAIGLTLASGVYGARVGWQLWWARHYDNPFAAFGIPEGQADQERAFALSLRWPAIAAASLAGAIVGALGSSCGWFTGWRWACLVAWAGAGAVGLAVEGAIMGAVLGRKRARIR